MWTVLLWILLVFLLLLVLFLVAPMRLDLVANYEKSKFEAEVFFSYLHPVLFSFYYSTQKRTTHTRIFGRKIKGSEKEEPQEKEEAALAAPVTEEKVSESEVEYDEIEAPSTESEPEPPPLKSGEEPLPEEESGESEGVGFFEKIRNSRFYRFARNRTWRKKIMVWLGRVWRSLCRFVRFDLFKVHARVGLKDPCFLGKLYGYLAAVRSALERRNRSVDLALEPVFMQNCFDFWMSVRFRTSVYRILAPFMVALFTMPYLSTYRLWRRREEKAKQDSLNTGGRK